MAEVRSEAERLRALFGLWERLAACLDETGPTDAARRLRADVIGHMQCAASSLAGVWLNQAVALVAWDSLTKELSTSPALAKPGTEWDTLRDQAQQLRKRVLDEQR